MLAGTLDVGDIDSLGNLTAHLLGDLAADLLGNLTVDLLGDLVANPLGVSIQTYWGTLSRVLCSPRIFVFSSDSGWA